MDHRDLAAEAEPAALREALAAQGEELRQAGETHQHGLTSVRAVRHRGHRIMIRTTYEITIDDEPFDAGLVVDNAGRVFYHGLPTQDFASTVDLVKQVVDTFPDFTRPDDDPDPGSGGSGGSGHEHGHEHEPEHGGGG